MSDTLSDEDVVEAVRLARLGGFTEVEDAMVELQRWRAAFAWLFQICGRVCAYDVGSGPKTWFARENSFTGHIAYGQTSLEAIEALRAEVKP